MAARLGPGQNIWPEAKASTAAVEEGSAAAFGKAPAAAVRSLPHCLCGNDENYEAYNKGYCLISRHCFTSHVAASLNE
jgi:hypothetical protein